MALHPVVRRTFWRLTGAYVLAWTSVSMVAGPGSAAFVALSGRLSDAGLFFAVFALAAAVGALSGGKAMDRFGRRPVLLSAQLLAALGFTAAGFGVLRGSLSAFVAGVALLAAAHGTLGLTRLAVAEMFPAAIRGRAVGWLQVSVTLGAVAGPVLLVTSGPLSEWLHRDPASFLWFLAPPLLLAAAWLTATAGEPASIARDLGTYHPAAPAEAATVGHAIPRQPLVASVASLSLAQGAMVAVMGVAGAHLARQGHGVGPLGFVMLLHFLGMFAFSSLVGRATDRIGRRATIGAGLLVLAAGGLLVAEIGGVPAFGVGLLLIGIGWSFAYIGGSVLLTDIVPVARRGRVVGRVDLFTALLAAGIAAAGGWWYADQGIAGLGLAAAALVALPLVVLVAVGRPRAAPAVVGAGAMPEPAEAKDN